MIQVKCPTDGTLHYADDNLVGRTIRCRKCGKSLTIGAPEPASTPEITREPAKSVAEPVPAAAPAPQPEVQSTTPAKVLRWEYLAGAGGLGVIVVVLLITFWPGNPAPVSNQARPGGSNPSVSENPSEPPPGAPGTERRVSGAERGQARGLGEGNAAGPLPACAQGRQPSRLESGQRIEPDGEAAGESNIRITNASDLDVAVRLSDTVSGKTSRFVYLRAGRSFAMEGIPAGAYMLRFQFGTDWMPECHGFVRDSLYGEFTDAFLFYDDRIRFYTVTLSTLLGGNTRTRRIDRRRFAQGDVIAGVSP